MEEEMRKEEKHQFLDGGYGWVIVSVAAFANILIIPILQGFGLLFRKVFKELEFTATDISLIINVNSAFGMILGLANGPLLKRYGYRLVAVCACFMTFVGLVLTSQANSFVQFILFYGILPSYGFVAMMASTSLALNSYFQRRRSFASGICMTLTGLGPIVMPLAISMLLKIYTVRGTALIISGLTLNTAAVCMLLHPVSWHIKKRNKDEEAVVPLKEGEEGGDEEEEDEVGSQVNLDYPETMVQSTPDIETMILPRRVSEAHVVRQESVLSEPCIEDSQAEMLEPDSTWWKNSTVSLTKSNINLRASTENGFLRSRHCSMSKSAAEISKIQEEDDEQEDKYTKKKWYSNIVKLFDLDLLKDPVYFNIWLGMSIAFTAEINFSLMLAIILGDRGFDIDETATLMSILATTDILFRFVAPFIGSYFKLPARKMYMLSLFMLIGSRACLTFCESYVQTCIVCAIMGMAKGFRTVYMTLVIPNHVPLEKLPSASSLQTVLNGILISICGPFLGYLRDVSGSYNLCIYVINCLTLTTIILWTIEFTVAGCRNKLIPTKDQETDHQLKEVSS